MGTYVSEQELSELLPAETAASASPVPTQVISNGEFNPLPQTARQRQVEARIAELADANRRRLGMRVLRHRLVLCDLGGDQSAFLRGDAGLLDQGSRARARLLGNGFGVVRLAAL